MSGVRKNPDPIAGQNHRFRIPPDIATLKRINNILTVIPVNTVNHMGTLPVYTQPTLYCMLSTVAWINCPAETGFFFA